MRVYSVVVRYICLVNLASEVLYCKSYIALHLLYIFSFYMSVYRMK